MMRATVAWIERDPRIRAITADTDSANVASRRLLDRLGFREVGPGREAGSLTYRKDARVASG
jgi:RimJ/RimL family protein N-acetyltransferase